MNTGMAVPEGAMLNYCVHVAKMLSLEHTQMKAAFPQPAQDKLLRLGADKEEAQEDTQIERTPLSPPHHAYYS